MNIGNNNIGAGNICVTKNVIIPTFLPQNENLENAYPAVIDINTPIIAVNVEIIREFFNQIKRSVSNMAFLKLSQVASSGIILKLVENNWSPGLKATDKTFNRGYKVIKQKIINIV